jgi:nitroreductase
MADSSARPLGRVRPLLRVRQFREFTAEPVEPDELDAIAEAARWSGSSRNSQPLRFIVITEPGTIARIAGPGLPQTRALPTAQAAVAIALPDEPAAAISRAYDEGRAAERMLIAASLLGLGAGIAWIRSDVRDAVREILRLPADWLVRTVMAIGHPTDAAQRPKSPPGQGRLPRDEVIFRERWPAG